MSILYPKDLTMTLASNRIQNEKRVFTTPEERAFVPNGGPFYEESMVLKDGSGKLLKPVVDYKILQLHAAATMDSGRNVSTIVYIVNDTINEVNFDYRVVGGDYNTVVSNIVDFLSKNDLSTNLDWNTNVFNKPDTFPPAPHYQTPETFTGWGGVMNMLNEIRKSITHGDDGAWQSHYSYIDRRFSNLGLSLSDYVTKTDASTIISNQITAATKDINDRFKDYYDRITIDNKLSGLSSGEVDLSNYYTRTQSDSRYAQASQVYTKAAADNKFITSGDVYLRAEANNTFVKKGDLSGGVTEADLDELYSDITTNTTSQISTKLSAYDTRAVADGKYATLADTYNRSTIDNKLSSTHSSAVSAAISEILSGASIANNLTELDKRIAKLEQLGRPLIPVGGVVYMAVHHTPASMAAAMGYGTWAEHASGMYIVARNTSEYLENPNTGAVTGDDGSAEALQAPTWTRVVGSKRIRTNQGDVAGNPSAYHFTMIDANMPAHNHMAVGSKFNKFAGRAFDVGLPSTDGSDYTKTTTEIAVSNFSTENWEQATVQTNGSGRPMDITPPTLVQGCWRRVS